jgi:hypothetical protein
MIKNPKPKRTTTATDLGMGRVGFTPNACVSDRRQRETGSRVKASVEAASCSLDAMVRPDVKSRI